MEQDPAIIPQMQENQEVSIHPHQRWELDSTFDAEIPGQFLGAQHLTDIPKEKSQSYSKESNTAKGQGQRQAFSRNLSKTIWGNAEIMARQRRKTLVPHGTLHAIGQKYGGLNKMVQDDRAALRQARRISFARLNINRQCRSLQARLRHGELTEIAAVRERLHAVIQQTESVAGQDALFGISLQLNYELGQSNTVDAILAVVENFRRRVLGVPEGLEQ